MHARNRLGLGVVNPSKAGFRSTTQSGDLVAGSHLPEPGLLGQQYGVVKPLPQMLVGGSNRDVLKESECQGTRSGGWEVLLAPRDSLPRVLHCLQAWNSSLTF